MVINVIKKILIVALALLMLAGCKKKQETPETSASPTTSAAVSDTTENATASPVPSPTVSTGSLKPPEVDTATKNPTRTASIPETPNPDKVVTQNPQKTAGAGSRSEEVSDTTVSATNAENAILLAKQFMKANNIYIPSNVELDREDNEYYYIHAYQVVNADGQENISSVGWFNVKKNTSEVTKGSADIKVGERPESSNQ